MRSQAALRMECGSKLPLLLPDAGLLQRRKLAWAFQSGVSYANRIDFHRQAMLQ